MPPKVYRPAIPSSYIEPDQPFGNSLWREKERPGKRIDIIHFQQKDNSQLEANVNWTGCGVEHRPKIVHMIKEYWDVFAQEGLRNPILGFQFVVDTGAARPICCRLPRYGMHESPVLKRICEGLKHNGIVEEDTGPWGAMVVLAAKPNQHEVHWNDYVWRICVSYRILNAVTRPFKYPIRRCDDAILSIGKAKYFIKMNLDSGYWDPRDPNITP